jgi:stage IV sporulation protein FB
MFGSVEPTSYDLRFSLLGIPVRVSPWFWLMGAILGYNFVHRGFDFLLTWMLAVFVSILVHELGHALTARSFGYPPRILLYQFGGMAMYEPYRDYTRSRSIAITLAGPGAGFLLFGLTLAFRLLVYPFLPAADLPPRTAELLDHAIWVLLFINLAWGLLNLLPVLPLDGGQVCRDVCSILSPHRGVIYAAWISVFVAAGAAALLFMAGMIFGAILFAMLCVQNFTAIQESRGGW